MPSGTADEPDPGQSARSDEHSLAPWLPAGLDDGLEALVIRIYLALMQHPKPSVSLLIAQGMEATQVARALRVLTTRHLISTSPDGEIEVPPPDLTLPAHATELERQAREARESAYELAQMYSAARSEGRPPSADIRTLTSLDEIHGASAEIISAGRARVRSFRAISPRTEQIFAAPDHAHSQPSYGADGSVLNLQAVFDNGVVGYPRALEVLERRAAAGERARFLTDVPFSALVVDDVAAVVDLSNIEATGRGSLLVRSRPMVRALARLADLLWDLGTPANLQAPHTVDERDESILALLAAGASDATIARRTGVSQRTVERRVAALMDHLGAGTRFQAGVQAARRGLLGPSVRPPSS